MTSLTLIEAAMYTGWSVELLESATSAGFKQNGVRIKLRCRQIGTEKVISQADLDDFVATLRKPWKKTPEGKRHHLPSAILEDIRHESWLECAICGKGLVEAAHIEDYATSLNHSPDNLLGLCPNHHTDYDLGSHIDIGDALAVKRVKRLTRKRMMLREFNAVKALANLMSHIESVFESLASVASDQNASAVIRLALARELQNLLTSALPDSYGNAERAKEDAQYDEVRAFTPSPAFREAVTSAADRAKAVTENLTAPNEATSSRGEATLAALSSASEALVQSSAELHLPPTVTCPRCQGLGWFSDVEKVCAYCGGSREVGRKRAAEYLGFLRQLVSCPHCEGAGQRGFQGQPCIYCRGDRFISRNRADEYIAEELNEVVCPHCDGTGLKGTQGHMCGYCGGNQVVSRNKFSSYDSSSLDEVECPNCHGRTVVGLNGDVCTYCGGAGVVTRKAADEHDEWMADWGPCPRCDGRGLVSPLGDFCDYCSGRQIIPLAQVDLFDPERLKNVRCLACGGSGLSGAWNADDFCSLCRGHALISRQKADAYDGPRPGEED